MDEFKRMAMQGCVVLIFLMIFVSLCIYGIVCLVKDLF